MARHSPTRSSCSLKGALLFAVTSSSTTLTFCPTVSQRLVYCIRRRHDADTIVHQVVRPTVRSAHIEIPFSDLYSIGDGPIALWVSGASGWFEIQPSAKYQAMYDQAREAIAFYYCALVVHETYNDACRGKKKARRPNPPTLDDIYLKYAVRIGDGIVRHEAEALCNKWAPFLISHFDKEEDLDWTDTDFAKSLRNARPVGIVLDR